MGKRPHQRTISTSVSDRHTSARPHVRYIGFDAREGKRRLKFSVKPEGRDSVEIQIEISEPAFTRASRLSIQYAAPMAFDKLTELLATKDTLDPSDLCLSDEDVGKYLRHRADLQNRDGRRRRSGIAA